MRKGEGMKGERQEETGRLDSANFSFATGCKCVQTLLQVVSVGLSLENSAKSCRCCKLWVDLHRLCRHSAVSTHKALTFFQPEKSRHF